MIDHVDFLEESPQLGTVADIATSEMDIRRERVWIASREIIEPAYLVSLAGEMVGKRRAEESRGSSDEKIHDERL
jgi:hypothetical protein